MFYQQAKESPKEHWSKDAALFDATADFEWLQEADIELHCSLRIRMERLDHALQFGWATDLWENLKEAVSADWIKRLSEINESDVRGQSRQLVRFSRKAYGFLLNCLAYGRSTRGYIILTDIYEFEVEGNCGYFRRLLSFIFTK